MAEDSESDAEKEFDPSPQRLARAREQGDVVRSDDVQAAMAMGGFLLALGLGGFWVVHKAGAAGVFLLGQADRLAGLPGADAMPEVASAAVRMAAPGAVILVPPAVVVLLWLFASQGLVFSPSKLAPKLSRLSVIANFGQKFGRSGLVDFAKKATKMVAVGVALTWYLMTGADDLFLAAALEPGPAAALMGQRIVGFLTLILALNAAFGGVDYLWQRMEFLRRNRMTRKEMTDEMKESEGDPQFKADRRRRAQEIAMQRMMTDVPKADVVIVNPTHYAVALKWDRARGRAPICVAKGVDEIAARIRERAQAAGVPLRQDPPTARMLHAALKIGEEVRVEHYAAVAAAIRFAEAMRKRARRSVLR